MQDYTFSRKTALQVAQNLDNGRGVIDYNRAFRVELNVPGPESEQLYPVAPVIVSQVSEDGSEIVYLTGVREEPVRLSRQAIEPRLEDEPDLEPEEAEAESASVAEAVVAAKPSRKKAAAPPAESDAAPADAS